MQLDYAMANFLCQNSQRDNSGQPIVDQIGLGQPRLIFFVGCHGLIVPSTFVPGVLDSFHILRVMAITIDEINRFCTRDV